MLVLQYKSSGMARTTKNKYKTNLQIKTYIITAYYKKEGMPIHPDELNFKAVMQNDCCAKVQNTTQRCGT